jgi:hypothetical protein
MEFSGCSDFVQIFGMRSRLFLPWLAQLGFLSFGWILGKTPYTDLLWVFRICLGSPFHICR